VISKSIILKNTLTNNLENISHLCNIIGIDSLIIFSINIRSKFESKVIKIDLPNKIVYIELDLETFIENFANGEKVDFWHHNKNTLYILRDGNISDLNLLFNTIENVNTKVVRGSSQKSHMLSPIDFRLSNYLMLLFNMDYNKVNNQNSFNILDKKRYLPNY
jgi:hypothetical protein